MFGIGYQELVLLGIVLAVLVALVALFRSQRDEISGLGMVLVAVGALVALWSGVGGLLLMALGIVIYAIRAPHRGRIPCPHCAEAIRPQAKLCPHCRTELIAAARR